MKFKPLFDRVLIEPDKVEAESKFGIILPETLKDKELTGKVIEVGDGENLDGDKLEMKLKVGDHVVFSKFSGSELKIDDKTYYVLRQIDVIGLLFE